MVWKGLSLFDSTDPYFIDPKEKVNTAVYCNKILIFSKREGLRLFGLRKYMFQQNGATPYTSDRSENEGKIIKLVTFDFNRLDY